MKRAIRKTPGRTTRIVQAWRLDRPIHRRIIDPEPARAILQDQRHWCHRRRTGKNREFQDGFSAGVDSLGFDARNVIEEESSLRDEIGDDLGDGAREWVRGFWAATVSASGG